MAKKPYHLDYEPRDSIFTRTLEDGVRQGIMPGRSSAARKWYRDKAMEITRIDTKEVMSHDPRRYRQSVQLGRMYMFYYDPKHKVTLPYYDRVPLIFPIEMYSDSFLGINFHYLPPVYRAKLMDAIYPLINNLEMDATTKIGQSQQNLYRIMKVIPKLRYFKPCIKKYLKSYVRSRFVSIAATEWDIALFLPLADFQKANQRLVWQDSVRKINRGR